MSRGWPWRGLDFVPEAMLIHTSLQSEERRQEQGWGQSFTCTCEFLL